MNDDALLPEEQARLARARVAVPPPPAEADRTVAALRQRGLLRPRRRRLAIGSLVAAAMILAALTWAIVPRARVGIPPQGPRFVLLLYAGSDPMAGTADGRRRECAEWARGLASSGVSITGEELTAESRELWAAGGPPPGGLPRGFFVVSAPDLDTAQQIASTCPHLRYGGRIVIQRVAG